MAISVVDPISPAVERTRQLLFRPFQLGKWFVLGFCAWLAELGEGGGSAGVRMPFGGGGGALAPAPGQAPGQGAPAGGMPPAMRSALEWVQANLVLVIAVAVGVVLVLVVIGLLLGWVQSRFKFIFLDNVVRDRTEIGDPWREFRREGNSLFWFNVLFSLAASFAFVVLIGVAALLALPDIMARQYGASAMLAVAVGVPALLMFVLFCWAIHLFLGDFVVPIMYLRRQGVMASWSEFRGELLLGRKGKFALYFLFRAIVLTIIVGFIALAATCATCCCAMLPYLGSVILLPLSVFLRQYTLYYLEQYGPPWEFFGTGKPPAGDLEFLDV